MHPRCSTEQSLVVYVGLAIGAAHRTGSREARFQGGRTWIRAPLADSVVHFKEICGETTPSFRNYFQCTLHAHPQFNSDSLALNLRAHSKWCEWRYVRLSLPQTAYRSRTRFGASFSDFVRYFIFWQLLCTGHPHFPPRFSSTSAGGGADV